LNRFALNIGNETRFLAGFFLLKSLSKKNSGLRIFAHLKYNLIAV